MMTSSTEGSELRSTVRAVRSRAPLRMSLAGGGTDVPPYPSMFGGAVISMTINRYAWCSITRANSDEIVVRSIDLNQTATFTSSTTPVFDGNLDLVKAIFGRLNVIDPHGLRIVLETDAPPGSGLGSSSALVVAAIAALSRYYGLNLTPYEIAKVAYVVEREDIGIAGGMQDQYSASYGGFNLIEFHENDVVEVMPLRLSEAMRCELEAHLLLCFTGSTRSSGGILERQIQNVVNSEISTMNSLHELKGLTTTMRKALHAEDLPTLASLLDDAWNRKKLLTTGISDPHLDSIYETAKHHGALGGKLLGAGGGGYFMFLTEPERREELSHVLEPLGVTVSRNIELCDTGVTSWEVPRIRQEVPSSFDRVSNSEISTNHEGVKSVDTRVR